MIHEVLEIGFIAGEIVVQAQDLVTLVQQQFHQVGTDKSRAAGDEYAGHVLMSSF
jgi:hypothetical protein